MRFNAAKKKWSMGMTNILKFPKVKTLTKLNLTKNDILFVQLKEDATQSVGQGWVDILSGLNLDGRYVIYKGDVNLTAVSIKEHEKRKKDESSKEFANSLR